MATTSRSTTVLAGLADIRGWQAEFYRDLHQYVDGRCGTRGCSPRRCWKRVRR